MWIYLFPSFLLTVAIVEFCVWIWKCRIPKLSEPQKKIIGTTTPQRNHVYQEPSPPRPRIRAIKAVFDMSIETEIKLLIALTFPLLGLALVPIAVLGQQHGVTQI